MSLTKEERRYRGIAARAALFESLRNTGGWGGIDPLRLMPKPDASPQDEAFARTLLRLEDSLRQVSRGGPNELELFEPDAPAELVTWFNGPLTTWTTTLVRTLVDALWPYDPDGVIALFHSLHPFELGEVWHLLAIEDILDGYGVELRDTWQAIEDARAEIGESWSEWLP
jgi:hypothetical protein